MTGKSPRRIHPLAGPAALIIVLLIGAPGFTQGVPKETTVVAPDCPNPKNVTAEFPPVRGANQPGPYLSTCDGTASNNGFPSSGNATGRPCAGCVGNADNKNPPGQFPGPQDANHGYECDLPGPVVNQGIAEGNPAHSLCAQVYPIT